MIPWPHTKVATFVVILKDTVSSMFDSEQEGAQTGHDSSE